MQEGRLKDAQIAFLLGKFLIGILTSDNFYAS